MRTVEIESGGETPAQMGRGGYLGTIKEFKARLNATAARMNTPKGYFGQKPWAADREAAANARRHRVLRNQMAEAEPEVAGDPLASAPVLLWNTPHTASVTLDPDGASF